MKIFLSSTFSDLKDDRTIAIKMLKDLTGNMTNYATGEIIAMEFFEAADFTSKEKCLTAIAECNLVIGIFGSKYGSIDPDTGLSYTELEYDTAAKNEIPILAFVKTVPERESLEEVFINKKIKSPNRLIAYYSTKEELADKLNTSIKRYYSSFEGLSYSSLWDIVRKTELELSANPFQMNAFFPENTQDAINTIIDGANNIIEYRKTLLEEHNTIDEYAYLADCYPEKCNLKAQKKLIKNVEKSASTIRGNFEILAYGMYNWPQSMLLAAAFLELQHMRTRLLNEPWSESLRQDVLSVRNKYCEILKESQYSD